MEMMLQVAALDFMEMKGGDEKMKWKKFVIILFHDTFLAVLY